MSNCLFHYNLQMAVKCIFFAALCATFVFCCHGGWVTWVKLNTSPVCFGARDNKYGAFTPGKNAFVWAFMLKHYCTQTLLLAVTPELGIARVIGAVLRMTIQSTLSLLMSKTKLLGLVTRGRLLSITMLSQATTPLRLTWSSSWERALMVCITQPSYEFGTVKICLTPMNTTMKGHRVQMSTDWCTRTKTSAAKKGTEKIRSLE